MRRIAHWDNYTSIRHFGGMAAISADDSQNRRADGAREFQSRDDIRADVPLQIATTDRKYKNGIVLAQTAALQPTGEGLRPAFVVRPGGQLRDVVRRRVSFKPGDFSEIVDRMRSVCGAAAEAPGDALEKVTSRGAAE